MFDPEKTELDEFLKEYTRARRNAVFFIENYWNKLHPDNPIILTDDEPHCLNGYHCNTTGIGRCQYHY